MFRNYSCISRVQTPVNNASVNTTCWSFMLPHSTDAEGPACSYHGQDPSAAPLPSSVSVHVAKACGR